MVLGDEDTHKGEDTYLPIPALHLAYLALTLVIPATPIICKGAFGLGAM